MRIGILTSGGDCPGINATIRGVCKTAINYYGMEVVGIHSGFQGLLTKDVESFTDKSLSGLLNLGGTMLGTSREKPFKKNGVVSDVDKPALIEQNVKELGLDCIVCIGGNGTQKTAAKLAAMGLNIVSVPKTIDNDLASTDVTFGFNTAIDVVTEALDRLHTTAESHHRIMLCEVMGRNAGWIALESGIAGSADVILIPEIPYDLNKIIDKVKERESCGKNFTIIVVAEGAKPKDGNVVISKIVKDSPDPIRLGGIGNKLAGDIECLMKDKEVRCTVLGHIQRGGNTCTYDRILSTRYGVAAVEMIVNREFGKMVCLKGDTITSDTLENVIGQKTKNVNPDGELVNMAKKIGISFAD